MEEPDSAHPGPDVESVQRLDNIDVVDATHAAIAEHRSECRLTTTRAVAFEDIFPSEDDRDTLVYTIVPRE